MTRRKISQNQTQSTNKKQTTPVMLDFAKLSKLVLDDLNKNNKTQVFFNKYKKEDVVNYLSRPQNYSKQLREMSNFLYIVSSHYRRLINYFAKLYLLDYIIEPYYIDKEKLNKRTFEITYNNICLDIENMNLKHELIKSQVSAWRDDVFYGYIHQTKDSFYIQKLDPNYCQISSNEDGCFIYSFDFSYFNGKDEDIFEQYPDEFKSLYEQYKTDSINKWIEIDSKNCFCLKVNEDISYPLVPFCGVFEALYDIEDYKALRKAKISIGNYKMLAMIMPLSKEGDSTNAYLLDPDEITKYYNFMAGMLPEEVGLLLSPTELQEFSFDKDKADTDTVAESTSQFWKQSGVEESLFSGGNTTGASIAKSIVTDEALSSGLIKQIERNVNRIIKKYNSDTYKFKVRILPTTIFNWQDVYEKYIKAATYGLPTKMMAASALGITPNVFNNMVFLENDVMGLTEKLQPLKSSSTMSPDSEGGAPAKSDDGLSDSGQATRDKDGNNKDNRNFNLDLDEVVE